MKIEEKFIQSKTGDIQTCEDGLFISDNFVAVVDGATSKSDIKVSGTTSGFYIKEIILSALSKLDYNCNAREAISNINREIMVEKEKLSIEIDMSASIIIYSIERKEIWNFGDCQCIINGIIYSHQKKIDDFTSEFRSYCNKKFLEIGFTEKELMETDLGRETILPILRKQSELINNDNDIYGYPSLNGKVINEENIIVYKLKENDEVVLSSDGYPILENTLISSEDHLSEILKRDPLLINEYKSTKGLEKGNISFDDRTYIKFVC